ncbi:MAG: M1 family metallopeptidase, partial [Bacteroidetes bacterium]|nr:M1 family metallopeptidase [Bacteroidota bacterium]
NDFGMCQWYPQIAVYDDVRGWDRTQYLGISEFYNEYGNWSAELTVPRNFIIASTGTLMNPAEVLTAAQLSRFNALSADSVTRIVLPEEVDSTARMISSDSLTWKFTAQNVRDFAWAASPNYVWDGTMTRDGVRIHAFYHPDLYRTSLWPLVGDASNWDEGAMMARHAIEHFSAHFGRYIYPQATVVSGPVRGMEYPMMIFADDGEAITNGLYYVIAHELGHQWYPMMVGNNETNYPFMDEGFNTYITATAIEDRYGKDGLIHKDFLRALSWMNLPSSEARLFEQRFYLLSAREEDETTVMSHPYSYPGSQFGTAAYQKPGTVLVMLRDVIGPDAFAQGMNTYYSRWLLKHPYPADFFNTMEDAAGYDLDWFWNQWFDQTWKLDMAVRGVKNEELNGRLRSVITLENREQAVMPATLRLTLADGSVKDIRFPVSIWSKGRIGTVTVDSLPAAVKDVTIDPAMQLADVNRLNNSWSMPRVEFDYGLNIANALLYPLDAYRINAGPAAGFNLRDGVELGASISGSYMGTDHRTVLMMNQGTRSGVPDLQLSYSTPLRVWDPKLTTDIRLFRLDGFTGWQWTIEKTFEARKSNARSYRRLFTINTSILSLRVNDDRYLSGPAEWDMTGLYDAGFISLKYSETFTWGKFFLRLDDEFGTPNSAFSYSKLTAESKLEHRLFGLGLTWRFFGGSSAGTVPVQTAHSLTRATGVERFHSSVHRTPVVGLSTRDNLAAPGGGNLFLDRDTIALNVAALNLAVTSGPFVLFADAGTVWDSSQTRFKQFAYDAGIGLQMNMGTIGAPGVSVGPLGIGLFFPLYIKDPARPQDEEFAYRWRLVLGVRL